MDIPHKEDQAGIIEQTHNRAHRNYVENTKQIEKLYYWPQMRKQLKQYVQNCINCNKNKYDRHPKKIPIGKVPIPDKEGEQLHLDIFYAQKLKFITCVDAYSKFLILKYIEDKSNIEEKVLELLQTFPDVKRITLDNEPSFTTLQFKSLMQRLQVEIYFCDPRHSTTNGQIERVHSTLIEIARCIKEEYNIVSDLETMFRAGQQYNLTIHSVTNFKPNDVFHNKLNHGNLPDVLKQAQEKMLATHNKNRLEKQFYPGEIVYEKIIGERNKLKPRYKKQQVKENLGNKIIITNRDRIIHKDNIKS